MRSILQIDLGGRFGSLVPDWIQEVKETKGAKPGF